MSYEVRGVSVQSPVSIEYHRYKGMFINNYWKTAITIKIHLELLQHSKSSVCEAKTVHEKQNKPSKLRNLMQFKSKCVWPMPGACSHTKAMVHLTTCDIKHHSWSLCQIRDPQPTTTVLENNHWTAKKHTKIHKTRSLLRTWVGVKLVLSVHWGGEPIIKTLLQQALHAPPI